jgi:hypothetical protein
MKKIIMSALVFTIVGISTFAGMPAKNYAVEGTIRFIGEQFDPGGGCFLGVCYGMAEGPGDDYTYLPD